MPRFNELGMNLVSLTMVLPVFLYSTIMESGKKHATIGKQKMKLVVASIYIKPLKVWQIVLRNIIKFLPWQLAHMMIFRAFAFDWRLPPFWMFMLISTDILPLILVLVVVFRKDHRGVHDLLAKTIVVASDALSLIKE